MKKTHRKTPRKLLKKTRRGGKRSKTLRLKKYGGGPIGRGGPTYIHDPPRYKPPTYYNNDTLPGNPEQIYDSTGNFTETVKNRLAKIAQEDQERLKVWKEKEERNRIQKQQQMLEQQKMREMEEQYSIPEKPEAEKSSWFSKIFGL